MFAVLIPLVLLASTAISATPVARQNIAQRIHANHAQNKCLTVRASTFTNGLHVQIADCIGAKHWVIRRGSTTVRLAGTNFCIDGGTEPGNGDQLKIWQCQENLSGQRWNYTPGTQLKLENQVADFCIDLDDSFKVQTWSCSGANNQVWTV